MNMAFTHVDTTFQHLKLVIWFSNQKNYCRLTSGLFCFSKHCPVYRRCGDRTKIGISKNPNPTVDHREVAEISSGFMPFNMSAGKLEKSLGTATIGA